MAQEGSSEDAVAVAPGRLDAGAALAIGAAVLFGLSLVPPWFGVSVTVGHRVFSASAGVRRASGGWLLVAACVAASAVLTLWRSLSLAVAAAVLCALSAGGVVLLVRRFPTAALPLPAGSTDPAQSRLVGAALAVLAVGLLAVGVVVHGVVLLRANRERDQPPTPEGRDLRP
jgi:hypothetical protein